MLNERNFPIILTTIFLIAGFILLMHHEMWRDELGEWAYAAASPSLSSLIRNFPYPHTMLWQILVYFLTRLTSNPVSMQLFHLVIAGCIIFLFARFSPFTKGQKVFFIFGYFPFFEYMVICRPYSLAVLFAFSFCSIFPLRFKKFILTGCILFLLANSNPFGLAISLSIGVSLLINRILCHRSDRDCPYIPAYKLIIGFLLIGAGCTLSYLQQSRGEFVPTFSRLSLYGATHVSGCLYTGFFPLFKTVRCFWHTNILYDSIHPQLEPTFMIIRTLIASLLILYSFFLLLNKREALLIYLLSTLVLLGSFSTYLSRDYRHSGFFFIIFISSLWIAASCPEGIIRSKVLFRLNELAIRLRNKVLYALLILHFLLGAIAAITDLLFPFSCAKEAANYIRKSNMQNWPMAAYPHYATCSLSAYLHKSDIKFIPSEYYYQDFLLPLKGLTLEKCLYYFWILQNLYPAKFNKMLFVTNTPLPPSVIEGYGLNEIANFTGSICGDEDVYFYAFKTIDKR